MKRLVVRIVLPVLVVAILVAGGALAWHLREQRTTYYTDADTIRKELDEAQVRDVLWQPAVALPPWINTAGEEYEPATSSDGLTLFFARGNAGDNADLYTSTRTPQGWSEPEPLRLINTAADELGPELSPDGRTLLYYSNRGGGLGGYDLWIARRNDDGTWSPPENLGPKVNSAYNEYGPSIDPHDPSLLYLVSNRPKPDDEDVLPPGATATEVREDMANRDYDIYIAVVDDEVRERAAPLASLNSPDDEGGPAVSPSGDFLYFCSDRPGGIGGFDIYRSRRLRGTHLEPRNLGDTLNTDANELDPSVTLGGFGLHFGSNRTSATARDEAGGLQDAIVDATATEDAEGRSYDLYFAASREVFSETESYRASIDWRGLWGDLWPYLLLMLLALLFLLAMLHAARRHRLSALSLLARCILASLLVHVILMALLSAWEVSTTLADAIQEGKGMRVRLTSPSVGGRLASQVRSGLTDVEITSEVMQEAARAEPAIEAARADARAVTSAASAAEQLEPASSSAVERDVADATSESAAAPSETATSVAPTAVAVGTPETPTRMQTPAPSAQPADAIAAASAARATSAAAQEPSSSSAQVALAPSSSTLETADASSVAGAQASVPDAAPSDAEGRRNEVPVAVVEGVDTLDLTLPTARQTTTEQSDEREVQIMADVATSPRQTSTASRRPQATDAPWVSRAPGPRDAEADSSIVGAEQSTPTDASAPASSAAASTARADALLSDPSTDAVASAPSLETAATTATGEPTAAASATSIATASRAEGDVTASSAASGAPTARLAVGATTMTATSTVAGGSRQPGAEGPPASDADAATGVPSVPALDGAIVALPGESTRDTPAAEASVSGAPSTTAFASARQGATERGATLSPTVITGATGGASATTDLGGASIAAVSTPEVTSATVGDRPGPASVDIPGLQTALPALADTGAGSAADDAPIDTGVTAPRGESARVLAFAATTRAPTVMPPSGGAPSSDALALADSTLVASADRPGEALVMSDARFGGAPDVASDLTMALPALEEAEPAETNEVARGGTPKPGGPEPKRSRPQPVLAKRGDASVGTPVAMAPGRIDRSAERSLIDRTTPDERSVARKRPRPEMLAAAPVELMPVLPVDVKLPEAVTNPFPQRAPEVREEYVKKFGGSLETEQAVEMALGWLSRHQSDDGHWDGKDYDDDCGECEGVGRMSSDIALTGLSLLCFLAADHSQVNGGPYEDIVERALEWMLRQQGSDGSLMRDESMYSHGIATMALAEALAMTSDKRLEAAVQSAVNFIFEARNRRIGGWRYDPGQVGDTSVTGWQVMAMVSARRAGCEVPDEGLEVASAWLDLVSRRSRPGLYAYQPGKRFSPAMTAEGMYIRQMLGRERTERDMVAGAEYLLDNLPDWEEDSNTYYWYYGTLTMFQHGGEAWDRWNEAVVEELLERQETAGLQSGSWPVGGQWSRIGGRVYQTALCCLTLEVYYRYLPLYVKDELAEVR